MAQQLSVNNASAGAPSLVLSSRFWLLTTTHKTSSQGNPIPLVSIGTYPHTYMQTFFKRHVDVRCQMKSLEFSR